MPPLQEGSVASVAVFLDRDSARSQHEGKAEARHSESCTLLVNQHDAKNSYCCSLRMTGLQFADLNSQYSYKKNLAAQLMSSLFHHTYVT